MTDNEKFLNTYRQLENALGKKTVKEYEDELPEKIGNILRLARTMRNFLSHEADGNAYITITPVMQKYLEETLWKVDEGYKTVDKKMTSINKGLTLKSSVEDAMKVFSKPGVLGKGVVPVFDKGEVVGYFDDTVLTKALEKGLFPKSKTLNGIKSILLPVKSKNVMKIADRTCLYDVSEFRNGLCLIQKNKEIIGYLR